jgi:hypothetical protein
VVDETGTTVGGTQLGVASEFGKSERLLEDPFFGRALSVADEFLWS